MRASPFVKQMLVAVGAQLASMSMGGSLGYPCVLMQQLQTNDSSVHADFDTLTWIASMHGISGLGATAMPTIMQLIGRKYTFIGSCLILFIGWILAAAAKDAFSVILSATFHGFASNCISIIDLVVVSEMLAPKYRSTTMMLLILNQTIGQFIVNSTAPFVNWRTVAVIMCIPALIAIIIALISPESPSWLAYRGKFEEAEENFKTLRGTDEEAIEELKSVITAQKESRRIVSKFTKLQQIKMKMKMKDFYSPSLFMFLILSNFYFCGGVSLFIYSKDVIEEATGGNPKIAVVGYLITTGSLLLGSFLSLILMRYLKTKTVLTTGLGCIISLLACALVNYLQTVGLIAKDSLLFLYFFLAYMILCNSGFNPVTYSLAIELMPVKHRGVGGALFNILTCLLYVVTIKSLPYLIKSITIPWFFFLSAFISMVCMILIWIYVPETKNRTLQEIEDYYNYGSFVKRRDLDDIELSVPIIKNS